MGIGTAPGAQLHRPLGYAGVALVGVVTGVAALVAGSADPKVTVAVVLAASAPFVLMVIGHLERVLLGLLILDIPLQWDVYLGYQELEGELGAIAGLNLSLTTFALACLYALWAAELLSRRPDRARPQLRAALPITAYLALNVVSVIVAFDPTLSWYYVALLVQLLLVSIYFASKVRTRESVQFVIAMLLVSLLVEALAIAVVRVAGVDFEVLGLSSDVSPDSAPSGISETQNATGPRLGGTIGSPNAAGGYLAMLIPIAASVLAAPFPRWLRRIAVAALGMGFLALILTFSRGGWVAAVVSIALLLVLGTRGGLFSPRMLGGAVAVMLLVAVPLYGAVGARLTGDDRGAAESRVPLMKLAGRIIVDRPLLGVGANNFATAIPRYAGPEFSRDWVYTVHNKYLLVAAEAGGLALLAFVWFLVAAIRRGFRAWRARDSLLSPLALGLTVALVGQGVAMSIDLYNNRPQLQVFFVVTGLTVSLAAMVQRDWLE